MLSNETASKIHDWIMTEGRKYTPTFDINEVGFDLHDFEEFLDYAFRYMSLLK